METKLIIAIILGVMVLAIILYFIGVSHDLFKNLIDWFGGL